MLSAIRKNQYSLTLIIVILTIVAFIWLYNRTNLSQVGTNDVARVYGKILQKAQIEQLAREYQLAIALGMTDFVRDLGGFSENEEQAMSEFIFNDLVIHHESPRLGIVPSDEAIASVIRSLPPFQNHGVFDPVKYESFVKERLGPRGFTERHLEEMVHDALCLKQLRSLITSPIAVSEAQVREASRIYQQVTAQILHFDRNTYLKMVKTISPEEKKAYYEKNKTNFRSDEQRAINYVLFEFSPLQQKLQGKERIHAMQQLSDAAVALKQKSEEGMKEGKRLEKIAVENGFKVVTTSDFNRQGEEAVVFDQKKRKQEVEKNKKIVPPALLPAAFKLTNIGDISEVVQVGQSFYVFSLARVAPSHSLEFSQVESQVETLLREEQTELKMQEAANKTVKAIHEAMKAGKSFADAVKGVGMTTELLTGMSPSDAAIKKATPQQRAFLNLTLGLKEGELSDVRHIPSGDFALYLQSRAPLSQEDWNTHHSEIEQGLLDQQRQLLFVEWLHRILWNFLK
ncbi:MAG TPA: SurA N-terminal domain-containing protein [Chthoniobacterales bacterium]|nr:SurA N-terminal domain-containing protein [Chthoniobacterales bacterium]